MTYQCLSDKGINFLKNKGYLNDAEAKEVFRDYDHMKKELNKVREMRKFVWQQCLLLTADKRNQLNKGKRLAYEEMWNELGGDMEGEK